MVCWSLLASRRRLPYYYQRIALESNYDLNVASRIELSEIYPTTHTLSFTSKISQLSSATAAGQSLHWSAGIASRYDFVAKCPSDSVVIAGAPGFGPLDNRCLHLDTTAGNSMFNTLGNPCSQSSCWTGFSDFVAAAPYNWIVKRHPVESGRSNPSNCAPSLLGLEIKRWLRQICSSLCTGVLTIPHISTAR